MKDNNLVTATCPRCGQIYCGIPAISREDNTTMICPDCGILEALQSIGVNTDEQLKILAIIHRSMGEN